MNKLYSGVKQRSGEILVAKGGGETEGRKNDGGLEDGDD